MRCTPPAACRCWPRSRSACSPRAPHGSRSWTASISTWTTIPGFAEACRQGRDLGFDGKTLIHPKQIEPANAAFGPSDADVAWARRIIAAYDEARAAGKGVVVVDGRLVENLHVLEARRLVALAEMIDSRKG